MSNSNDAGAKLMATLIMLPILGIVAFFMRESSEDKAAKPGVVADMIDDSLSACEYDNEANFKARLNKIMMKVRTKRLRQFQENNITVCLDTRLASQENGFFDRRIEGVYYSRVLSSESGPMTSVLTIWDNGKAPTEDKFWKKDASDWGSEVMTKFAKAIKRHGTPKEGEHKIAGVYSYRCGDDSTCHEIRWKSVENFDQDTIRKNPVLEQPPVKFDW